MQPRSQPTVALLPEAALASIPEEEPAAMQKVKKVVKKKRRRKMKRGSRVTQPGGMTDQEKSIWLLEHCKVLMSSWILHAVVSTLGCMINKPSLSGMYDQCWALLAAQMTQIIQQHKFTYKLHATNITLLVWHVLKQQRLLGSLCPV